MGDNRNSYSKNDHDATFMRMKEAHMLNGQLKPGYNLQIGVSDQYVLHLTVSSERNDYKTFIPFLESYKKNYGFIPKYVVAGAGYGGLLNYRYLKMENIDLFQKYPMYKKDTKKRKRINNPYLGINIIKNKYQEFSTINGEELDHLYTKKNGVKILYSKEVYKRISYNEKLIKYQKEAIRNLNSPLGIELRVQKSIQVEGAFSVIKDTCKYRRSRRFGIENVKTEIHLIVIGYII